MSIAADVHQPIRITKAENDIPYHPFRNFFNSPCVCIHDSCTIQFSSCCSFVISEPSCKRSLSIFHQMFCSQSSLTIEPLLLMLISSFPFPCFMFIIFPVIAMHLQLAPQKRRVSNSQVPSNSSFQISIAFISLEAKDSCDSPPSPRAYGFFEIRFMYCRVATHSQRFHSIIKRFFQDHSSVV
jgi:hypothetical protein